MKGALSCLSPGNGRCNRSEFPSEARFPSMLIFHYHLFKNAGTSVDEMLKANFGDKWDHAEFRNPVKKNSNVDEVTEYLKQRPQLLAFSSHTALLPLPQLGRPVFPIFFIRHPIDRIKSAYTFERQQIADTHGARLAKEQDFTGYVRHLLDNPRHRQARNFQTSRLACNEPPENGTELERAMRTLDALSFVGLVEQYDRSIERLRQCLTPFIPSFEGVIVHTNKTRARLEPMQSALQTVEQAIGSELCADLMAANTDDMALYGRVQADYASH